MFMNLLHYIPLFKDMKVSPGLNQQLALCSLGKSSFYYQPTPESALNLQLMREMDRIHLKRPFFGVPRMHAQLLKLLPQLAGFGHGHTFEYIFKILPGIDLLLFAAGQQRVVLDFCIFAIVQLTKSPETNYR
jgi:hypothetical protein